MNQSKGLKYEASKVGSIPERSPEVIKPARKRNTRKLARLIEPEVVGQSGEDTGEALPEGGEGDALGEVDNDI